MNIYVLLAGFASGLTTLGHFFPGFSMYVKPMLKAEMSNVAKHVMLSVYHYMSVFLCLATVSLIYLGLKSGSGAKFNMLFLLFLGSSYGLMAIAQLLVSLFSGIRNGIWKMFQWVLFLTVAILTFLGI